LALSHEELHVRELLPCGRGSQSRHLGQRLVPASRAFSSVAASLTAVSLCQKTPRNVALRRAYRKCVRNVSACSASRQQQSAELQAFYASPLTDSNRRPLLTMEVSGRYWRARPGTRDHVFAANWRFMAYRTCPRVPARGQADVPVSYRGLFSVSQNTRRNQSRLVTLVKSGADIRRDANPRPRYARGRSGAHVGDGRRVSKPPRTVSLRARWAGA
jgi:hypothetical protein